MRNSTKFRIYNTINISRRKEWHELRGKVITRRYVAEFKQIYDGKSGNEHGCPSEIWRLTAHFGDVKEPVNLGSFSNVNSLYAFLGVAPPSGKETVE